MTASASDGDLVSAYAARGSQSAFQTLVSRHVNLVYATALRHIGDPGIAEEITQNVFLALARKAPRLTGTGTLAGWLHRSTLLETKARVRAELRRQRRDSTAAELMSLAHEGTPSLEALTPMLDEALVALAESDRLALVLRFLEDRSLRDVGSELGIHEDAARKRVERALERLAAVFRKRGFALPALGGVTALLGEAAAHAAPAAVSASTVNAVAAGSALAGAPLTLFNLMSLAKSKIAAACLVLALTAPVSYQWYAVSAENGNRTRLQSELKQLREQINTEESVVASIERGIRRAAAGENDPAAGGPGASTAARENEYRWDDHAGFVRVPKTLLPRLAFGEFKFEPRGKERLERVQLPPLSDDGTPSPGLLSALGLDDDEAEWISDLSRRTFAEFDALVAARSYMTNIEYSANNQMVGITWVTPAFPEEGARLRDAFSSALVSVLGQERTGVFWQQAQGLFADRLDDFGAAPKQVSASLRSGETALIEENYFREDGSLRRTHQAHSPRANVPESLRLYVEAMELAAQKRKEPTP